MSVYSDLIVADAPVAYWRMDDATAGGTLTDTMGAHDGTVGSTIIPSQEGVIDPASSTSMLFDTTAATSTCTAPDDAAWNPTPTLSVEAWVRPTADANLKANNRRIVCHPDNSDSHIQLTAETGGLKWNVVATDLIAQPLRCSAELMPPGAWTHIVGTYNTQPPTGTGMMLYINGRVVAARGVTFAPRTDLTGALIIGAKQSSGGVAGDRWKGLIDEVAFYNYTLTTAQVVRHYANGILAKPSKITTDITTEPVF